MVGKGQQALGERAVQDARQFLHAVVTVGVQIRPPGVADEQCVAGEYEPGLVGARMVGDDVGVMGERVARRGDGPQLGVSERHDVAVGERMMREVDARALRQVGGRARARDELGQPGHVVSLHVRLEHGDDRHALRLGQGDVVVDQVDVRVDHRERAVALAAQQIRRTRRLVVEQLPEEHVACLQDRDRA